MLCCFTHFIALLPSTISGLSEAKRRRLESAQRSMQSSQRIEQLSQLHKMASDTLNFCTKVLRSEESAKKESEREYKEVEMQVQKAHDEKLLAEEYMYKYGVHKGGHDGDLHFPVKSGEMDDAENIENEGGVHKIGGIPSKFLDLSHFPHLQRSMLQGGHSSPGHEDLLSPEEPTKRGKKRAIIDCTEESTNFMHFHRAHLSGHGMKVDVVNEPEPFGCYGDAGEGEGGVPREVALARSPESEGAGVNPRSGKQNTKRVYVTDASLSHVNGTYIQEGRCNGAPLFVRVGPPKKFMNRWDCSVVLRREVRRAGAEVPGEETDGMVSSPRRCSAEGGAEYVWKIGLVPAERVAHPRIICYYVAGEEARKRVDWMDKMGEDDDDDDDLDEMCCIDPPEDGWRVFQHESAPGAVNLVEGGRSSGLKIHFVSE